MLSGAFDETFTVCPFRNGLLERDIYSHSLCDKKGVLVLFEFASAVVRSEPLSLVFFSKWDLTDDCLRLDPLIWIRQGDIRVSVYNLSVWSDVPSTVTH